MEQTKRERFQFLKEQLGVLPAEIRKLELQQLQFKRELDEMLETQLPEIAEPWNGEDEVVGRLVLYDRKNWNLVLKVDEMDFVLVSVKHLESIGSESAKFVADSFANQKFPRAISNHGSMRLSAGYFESDLTATLPFDKPFKKPNQQQQPQQKWGHSNQTADGRIVKW